MLIQGRHDVVLRGCGWQTRIASPALNPEAEPTAGGPAAPASASTFTAVITIAESEHVQLLSFAVEAAPAEVGVLIDGTGTLTPVTMPIPALAGHGTDVTAMILETPKTLDVTVQDLVITASTLPGILAHSVALLQIERNRVAMENVGSSWPAVWVSGKELRVVRNWLGIHDAVNREWLPFTVTQDLAPTAGTDAASAVAVLPLHPGGLQIAGPSVDVFVLENEIDRAGRNGITLGSVTLIDDEGDPTGEVTGVTLTVPGLCDTPVTVAIPGKPAGGGDDGRTVIASGELRDVQICRNRIRQTGLSGIGPVGFFDPSDAEELINITNLTIAANTISSTLLGTLGVLPAGLSMAGYGAIGLPDVEHLIIRDNTITDFARHPGDAGCGIFVLHGQMVEISRNHVLESRDWTETPDQSPAGGLRGGIVLGLVTPPPAGTSPSGSDPSGAALRPVYLPHLPALRLAENSVRVTLGNALFAAGYGPFSIVNNHLATGGTVKTEGPSLAETVIIVNLSTAIELQGIGAKVLARIRGLHRRGAARRGECQPVLRRRDLHEQHVPARGALERAALCGLSGNLCARRSRLREQHLLARRPAGNGNGGRAAVRRSPAGHEQSLPGGRGFPRSRLRVHAGPAQYHVAEHLDVLSVRKRRAAAGDRQQQSDAGSRASLFGGREAVEPELHDVKVGAFTWPSTSIPRTCARS